MHLYVVQSVVANLVIVDIILGRRSSDLDLFIT
jgi:hypothetical protein